jgi:competence protein ComEC
MNAYDRVRNWIGNIRYLLPLVAVVFPTIGAAADCAFPNAEVVNAVVLRAEPTTNSAKRGRMLPGEGLPLVSIVPRWYGIRNTDGTIAFASKRWVEIADCDNAPTISPNPDDGGASFTIDVLDVGTGLSVLARGPDFALLYDAGSNDDFGVGQNNRTLAYLRLIAPGLTTLNHVVLSHPHKDHVELLPDVIRQFTVDNIWDSGSRGNLTCGYWSLLQEIVAKPSIRYHTVLNDVGTEAVALGAADCTSATVRTISLQHAGRIDSAPLPLGTGASMEFLYADGTSYKPSQNPNRNSLVVRLNLGSRRVLFMGDAPGGERKSPTELPAEDSIEGKLLKCCAQDLFADVLIVGHHGSMTSSRNAFTDAVGASIYAISSGPKKYGAVTLPDSVIVQALKLKGTVFETNTNDFQCANASSKVGGDNDGKAGGCDAIRITITGNGQMIAEYNRDSD